MLRTKVDSKSDKNLPLRASRKSFHLQPNNEDTLLSLSGQLLNIGKHEEARKLLTDFIKENGPREKVGLELATCLYRMGNYSAAYRQFHQQLSISPQSANLHNGAGACLQALKEYEQAVHHFTEAIKLRSDNQNYYINLSHTLASMSEFEGVVECADIAYKLSNGNASILAEAADLLFKHEAFEYSASMYLEHLKRAPQNAQAFNNLGLCHKALGNLPEAEKCFLHSLIISPDNSEFLYNLSTVSTGHVVLNNATKHKNELKTSQNAACYHFAMGKALSDIANYHDAFQHFEKGNKALEATAPTQRWTVEHAPMLSGIGCEIDGTPQPIFIVGMPRSGTTLVEQVLSAHSDVFGAGERNWLSQSVKAAVSSKLRCAKEIETHIVEGYFAQVPRHLIDKSYITDKMPLNFRYVRTALAAFPNAQIVHVSRDPRAVAWSNYRTYFTLGGPEMSYSCSKESIVDFMQFYCDTVKSWRDLSSDRLHHLSYDEFVENPEFMLQDLMSKMGLKPEDGLTNRHQEHGVIRTASAAQARKKIYKNSNTEWQKYYEFAPRWFDRIEHIFK